MNLMDVAMTRLNSQQITGTKFNTAKDMVGWMGAMQAQDYAMSKWALGVRLPNSTEQEIEAAIHNGEIIRTHLLRPTWHLVSADDIYWMLELTAPQIKSILKPRHRELELTKAVIAKSRAIMEKVLRGGRHVLREELIAELRKAKIATENNRASHLFLQAELEGVICSGGTVKGKPTYALLEERVLKPKPLTRDEALAKLAERYFTSHAPATLQDFVWWSGLSVGDARCGLDLVKSDLVSETVDSKTYWLPSSFSGPRTSKESVHLLPAFDEFIISYTDRSASLPHTGHKKAVSDNGIFRPTIVVNGKVIGLWKRTIKKDKVLLETEYFQQPDKTQRALVEKASATFGGFLGKEIEI